MEKWFANEGTCKKNVKCERTNLPDAIKALSQSDVSLSFWYLEYCQRQRTACASTYFDKFRYVCFNSCLKLFRKSPRKTVHRNGHGIWINSVVDYAKQCKVCDCLQPRDQKIEPNTWTRTATKNEIAFEKRVDNIWMTWPKNGTKSMITPNALKNHIIMIIPVPKRDAPKQNWIQKATEKRTHARIDDNLVYLWQNKTQNQRCLSQNVSDLSSLARVNRQRSQQPLIYLICAIWSEFVMEAAARKLTFIYLLRTDTPSEEN